MGGTGASICTMIPITTNYTDTHNINYINNTNNTNNTSQNNYSQINNKPLHLICRDSIPRPRRN